MSAPKISAYMNVNNAGRRRSFKVGAFTVMVEPHEDDRAQAEFTEKLAVAASEMTCEECGEQIDWIADSNGKIACNNCGTPNVDPNRHQKRRPGLREPYVRKP